MAGQLVQGLWLDNGVKNGWILRQFSASLVWSISEFLRKSIACNLSFSRVHAPASPSRSGSHVPLHQNVHGNQKHNIDDEYNNYDVEVNMHRKQILNLTLACDLDLEYTNIGHICNKYCLVMEETHAQ